MGNPLLFRETDFTVGFADPIFPIRQGLLCRVANFVNVAFEFHLAVKARQAKKK